MTCREKLTMEHPFDFDMANKPIYCPDDYGYLDKPESCGKNGCDCYCDDCWNREIPEENTAERVNKKQAVMDYCFDHVCSECVLRDAELKCSMSYTTVDYDSAYEKIVRDKDNKNRIRASLEQLRENGKIACEGILEGVKNTSASEDIAKLRETFEEAKADILARHKDPVNHPGHYESGKFECIDVMLETQGKEAVMGFCICNAFKYLYRHNRKNGIEDVKKAQWYIDKYLELAEEDT